MIVFLAAAAMSASLAAPATEGGLPLAPGRVVTVTPCVPDPAASCWREALPLRSFAAEDAARRAPVTADVRLAWQGSGLLVKASDLPPGVRVEVSLSRALEDRIDASSSVLLDAGVSRVPATPGLETGAPRRVRVHLRVPDGDGTTLLTWAPWGSGDLARPAWLLPVERPAPASLAATRRAGKLVFDAPGADRVEIVHERPLLPRVRVGVPPPWSAAGPPPLAVDPPVHTGWYTVTATWRREGRVSAIAERRVHLTAEVDPGIATEGMFPAPRTFTPGSGRPFRPGPTTGVVAAGPVVHRAAVLLAEELRRFTGQPIPVRDGPFQPGDAWVGLEGDMAPLPGLPAADLPAEGFRIATGASGAMVCAADPRGAVYGALALADAVGPDGEAIPFTALDAPDLPWRVLYHSLTPGFAATYPVDRYREFLTRAVARGRFNLLAIGLDNGWKLSSHPEINAPGGWTRDQLQDVLEAARDLGLVVVPATNVPAHAAWLVQAHPELAEDVTRDQACTRHPDYRRILGEIYDELWNLFGRPPFFHIGHDEALWVTEQQFFEDQRCPRCAGTPRWRLYAEDLMWHHAFFASRGVRMLVWADVLAQGGSIDRPRVSLAVDLIPRAVRSDFVLLSWSNVFDPPSLLEDRGFPLMRVHTGYDDWQRAGLREVLPALSGEGIAIFTPAPWIATTFSAGSDGLRYHWPAAMLAGLTGWRTDLADRGGIDETLAALAGLPGFLPGFRSLPGTGSPVSLPVDGPVAGPADPAFLLPASARVGGVTFRMGTIRAARPEAPVRVKVGRRVGAIALLQATAADHAAELDLTRSRGPRRPEVPAAVRVRARYPDGEVREASLGYGLDTFAPDGSLRSTFLWGTAGTLSVPSPAAADDPAARDRALFRWDWVNPRPGVPVDVLEIEPVGPGIAVMVAAAAGLPA
ncbi:MAG: family 20 glycosylhydrolase [Deltaproteobacteria bacterium]|nr:family 20 glycosylhydrolase [Deltaproteobacteria bacterium]